jgi:carboxylesterase
VGTQVSQLEPCLLVHGLTASPGQVVPQKEALEDAGYRVVCPTLHGHATRIEDLDAYKWEDWYSQLSRELDALRTTDDGRRTTINYIGMSWGALLGLKLAIDRPNLIRRMVCIGTPLLLYRWMLALLPILTYSPLRWLIKSWPKDFARAVRDPEGREVYRAAGYDCFPMSAVQQVVRLQRTVRPNLSRVKLPMLILHGRHDQTAPPAGAELLKQSAGGPAELIWCERSGHVATLDYDRDLINARIVQFLAT